jgi:hypothetical protein
MEILMLAGRGDGRSAAKAACAPTGLAQVLTWMAHRMMFLHDTCAARPCHPKCAKVAAGHGILVREL